MIKSILGAGLLVITSFMQIAYADQAIGKVIWTRGFLLANGRILHKGSPFFRNDVLTTDNASLAEVEFSDGSLMTFKQGTTFTVNQYDLNKRAKTGSFISNLSAGGFRTITGLIARRHPTNYQVNTPVATIGVRGTDYQAVLANGALYVAVLSGEVCLNNSSGAPTGNENSGLMNWASNPSVHMPQVLAVPDQKYKVTRLPNCVAAPLLTGVLPPIVVPSPIIPTPITIHVDAASAFSGSPLFFSITFSAVASALFIPPNSITINPVTGVITIMLEPGTFGEYLINVTAANRCGAATTSFTVTYDDA